MTHAPTHTTRRAMLVAALAGLASGGPAAAKPEVKPLMKIRFAFADQLFTATLDDTPSTRDFASMLPLDLSIEDYATNEKIAHLPRKLTTQGSGPFGNEAPGDLGYYAPWGNLAMYHGAYRYSAGLIRLGRFDDGIAPLLKRGTYPLRIERLG